MRTCVFAGTFDPITIGHIDIIERAGKLFDSVHVVIMDNVRKSPMFNLAKRLRFLKEATVNFPFVTCTYHSGLMVDYLRQNDIQTVIRGIRNSTDFDYERLQENINRHLIEDLEVVYLGSNVKLMHISSSFVRELIINGKDVSEYVPFDISAKD